MKLRAKMSLASMGIVLFSMIVSTIIIAFVINKQNRERDIHYIHQAFTIIQDNLQSLRGSLHDQALKLASREEDIALPVKFHSESKNNKDDAFYMDGAMRDFTTMLYKTCLLGSLTAIAVYDMDGDLLSFAELSDRTANMGYLYSLAEEQPYKTAVVRRGVLNTADKFQFTPFSSRIARHYDGDVPQAEQFYYDTWGTHISLITNAPLFAMDYIVGEKGVESKQVQVGVVMLAKLLELPLIERLATLTGTQVNVFSAETFSVGMTPEYTHLNPRVKERIQEEGLLSAEGELSPVIVDNIVEEKAFWEGVLPLDRSQQGGSISVLLSKQIAQKHTRQMISFLLAVSVSCLICVIPIAFGFANTITRPLMRVEQVLKTVSEGKGDLTQRLAISSHDEVGTLSKHFNMMAETLQMNIEALKAENTERKRAEEELQQKNEQLEHLDKLKDEFLANTSHELRTPLNGIIGIAESMLDGTVGPLTEEQQINLSLITASGRRLTNLVNDILDFSKLQHHELHIQCKPINLHSIAEVVIRLSQPLIVNKPVELVNAVAPDCPAIDGDEARLQQILHNLVGNSIKFTEQGTVSISAQEQKGKVMVTVSDTGIGISKEQQGRIFESFEQADGSTARKYGGTGLGLAITKQLVELHRGEIWVESEVGRGSNFLFTLPVSRQEAVPIRSTEALLEHTQVAKPAESLIGITYETPLENEQTSDNKDMKQFHILIVDDEPVNLHVLKNFLSRQQYTLTLVTDGNAALEKFQAGSSIDLVLLDVMMPGMSGYEVCEHLRKKWSANELPVMMLTAKNQVSDLVRGFQAGSNDYLTKPFSKEELLARVNTHLQIKSLTAENVRMDTEMKVAQKIQTSLLPNLKKIAHPDFEFAAIMKPCDEIGGDYYDVLRGLDDSLWLAIGDVSGHGVTPGLIMMMAQTVHAAITTNYHVTPKDVNIVVNKVLYSNVQERLRVNHFMTFTTMKYLGDGRFQYAGAHLDLLVYRRKNQRCERIKTPGTWLNFIPDISHAAENSEFTLDVGDLLVLYTDGLTEIWDDKDTMLDIHGFIDIVQTHAEKAIEDVRDAIVADAMSWCKNVRKDDMTLLVARRIT